MKNVHSILKPSATKALLMLGLTVLTATVFAPVRRHEFVNFDDQLYVYENPLVLDGLTWRGVYKSFTEFNAANWHPVTWLSHMIDVELFGVNPGAHHVVNLLLHIAATLLLMHILHRATGALWRSACVAALFAIHPLHVESVAWVAERKDVLSALFFLATIWAHMQWVRTPHPAAAARTLLYAALAVLAKPMAVTLPFVLLLFDYWPLERVDLTGIRQSRRGRLPLYKAFLEKAPLFAIAALGATATFFAQKGHGAMAPFSAPVRLSNAVVSYGAYLTKLFAPVNLAVFYPHPGMPSPITLIVSAATLIGITAAVIKIGRARRWALAGWLWYCGMLVPVIGIIQVGSQAMADRYMYLPAVGIFIIAAWAAALLHERARVRAIPVIAAIVVIAALSWQARLQTARWKNSITLMRHAVETTDCNYLALNNIGVSYFTNRDYDSALIYFDRALYCDSTYSTALYNKGLILAKRERFNEALGYFRKTIRYDTSHARAYHSIGEALAALGRDTLAPRFSYQALERDPSLWQAHNSLAAYYHAHEAFDSAISHYRRALAMQPRNAGIHNSVALSLWQAGNEAEAEHHFVKALSIDSTLWQACNNFGLFLMSQNRLAGARAALNETVALAPDSARPYLNRGLLRARTGDKQGALADFTHALRLDSSLTDAQRHIDAVQNASTVDSAAPVYTQGALAHE